MNEWLFGVLGPVVVHTAEGVRSPGGPVVRSVLVALVLNANRALAQDRLLEDVWGDDRPPTAHTLQSCVSGLRSLIGEERIEHTDHSYVLHAADDEIDARRFELLVQEAIEAEDPQLARQLCLDSFVLWRGVPFGDLADLPWLRSEARRLEEVRLEAIETCARADLELGRHREIIGSLRAAVDEFPFNETLWGYYLQALDRSGRQPEALVAYSELAGLLRTELGIEPNAELQSLRERILTS